MDKLQQQHLKVIQESSNCESENCEKCNDDATACASITKEHMEGFAEWLFKNGWVLCTQDKSDKHFWQPLEAINPNGEGETSTSQLIELYFKSMEK